MMTIATGSPRSRHRAHRPAFSYPACTVSLRITAESRGGAPKTGFAVEPGSGPGQDVAALGLVRSSPIAADFASKEGTAALVSEGWAEKPGAWGPGASLAVPDAVVPPRRDLRAGRLAPA